MMYQNSANNSIGAGYGLAQSQQGAATAVYTGAPPQPTRFSNCAGQLDSHVSQLSTLVERFSRVADRLGGAVPEEAQKAQLRGSGGNVAAQIEQSLEDFESTLRRAERVIERLESL